MKTMRGDGLVDRYPLLAHWKKEGLRSFPNIPPSMIPGWVGYPYWETFLKDFRKEYQKSKYRSLFRSISPQQLEDMAARIFIEKTVIPRLKDLLRIKKEEWFHTCTEAAEKIIDKSEDRKTVLRNLGKKLLPNTKGGTITPLKIQKKVLTLVYYELYDCIKEIRSVLRIPLKRDKMLYSKPIFPPTFWHTFSQTIREKIPQIGDLFEDDELNLLVLNSSISKCCYAIIIHRFAKSNMRISRSTLRNIIEKTPVL